MKPFRAFLTESPQSPAPQGVLFHGNHIVVGAQHRVPVQISDSALVQAIIQHGADHGFFYEGDGGDAPQPLFGLKTVSDYRSGFDVDLNRSYTRFPYQMLSVLAANTGVNKPWKRLAAAGRGGTRSIFDAVLYSGLGREMGLPEPDREGVTAFFSRIGLLDTAHRTPATLRAARKFLQGMEAQGYEHRDSRGEFDWQTGTTPLQIVSREGEDLRNTYILDHAPAGVYIIGSGHLRSMVRILDARGAVYVLIGGEEIQ